VQLTAGGPRVFWSFSKQEPNSVFEPVSRQPQLTQTVGRVTAMDKTKRIGKRMMNKIIYQSATYGFLIGTPLALYISLTMFWLMSHDLWLALHNVFVIASLVVAAFIGYRNHNLGLSMRSVFLSIAVFFSIVMFLYIGSYTLTSGFLADKMVWIPFFYNDYNYHSFTSAAQYLKHGNNYVELLQLQVFSFLISSVMYFLAGGLGYASKAAIEKMGKPWSVVR
jgi:hypothetical protein